MEDLNNPESEIYKKTLEKQKLYISTRLKTIKNRILDDTMGCCDEKEKIAKHLNMGLAQNLVQTFFKWLINVLRKCLVSHSLLVGDRSLFELLMVGTPILIG
jgi:hypothetical protein